MSAKATDDESAKSAEGSRTTDTTDKTMAVEAVATAVETANPDANGTEAARADPPPQDNNTVADGNATTQAPMATLWPRESPTWMPRSPMEALRENEPPPAGPQNPLLGRQETGSVPGGYRLRSPWSYAESWVPQGHGPSPGVYSPVPYQKSPSSVAWQLQSPMYPATAPDTADEKRFANRQFHAVPEWLPNKPNKHHQQMWHQPHRDGYEWHQRSPRWQPYHRRHRYHHTGARVSGGYRDWNRQPLELNLNIGLHGPGNNGAPLLGGAHGGLPAHGHRDCRDCHYHQMQTPRVCYADNFHAQHMMCTSCNASIVNPALRYGGYCGPQIWGVPAPPQNVLPPFHAIVPHTTSAIGGGYNPAARV